MCECTSRKDVDRIPNVYQYDREESFFIKISIWRLLKSYAYNTEFPSYRVTWVNIHARTPAVAL